LKKISELGVIKAIMGNSKFGKKQLSLPKNGAWVVQFDITGREDNFSHVELDTRCKRELFEKVSCAVYDHYNVTKSGFILLVCSKK